MSIEMSWICPKCGAISPHETETVCKDCGTPLVCTQVSADEARSYMKVDNGAKFNQWIEEMKEKYVIGYEKKEDLSQYVPKCPTCGCPKIRYLTKQENTATVGGGIPENITRTTGKTFICLNCGYAW